MKDYNKIFADENKYIFDRRKELQDKVDKTDKKIGNRILILGLFSFFFLIYFIYGWSFLGFRWEWAANFYKTLDEDQFCRIFISFFGALVLVFIWVFFNYQITHRMNKLYQKYIDGDKKMLQGKATEFATTTYLNDMFSALGTVFTLDTTFKDTFKAIMPKFEWFDYDGFRPWGKDVTFSHDKNQNQVLIQEQLIIRHEGSKYQLKKWDYKKEAFCFFFEKINPNGLVEKNVEFRLPVID